MREQRDRIEQSLGHLRNRQDSAAAGSGNAGGGIVAVTARAVIGQNKNNPMVSFEGELAQQQRSHGR